VSKEKLGPNMRKIKDERTKSKRHEQVRDTKKGEKPISPRMKRRVDSRIRGRKRKRHSSLQRLFSKKKWRNHMQANT